MIQEISDEIFYFDVNRVIDVMQIAIHLRLKITISIHLSIKIDFFSYRCICIQNQTRVLAVRMNPE